MDLSSLWRCPVCQFDGKEPTQHCRRCGCHLLLLVKIKIEAWRSIVRIEEAKSSFLYALGQSEKKPDSSLALSTPKAEPPELSNKSSLNLLKRLRSLFSSLKR
jgi:hypothetical protein